MNERSLLKRKQPLFDYLISLPQDLQIFLDIRNPEWFERDTYNELLEFLRKHNIGLVVQDNNIRPLLLDLTVPKCFIRYAPSGDYSRLDKWFEKINEWGSRGLKEAYFFVQGADDKNLL